jgi:dihydrofolate reductase
MRKVVAGLFISLDGVVESPDQWQFDVFDDAMGAAIFEQVATQDAALMGRVTYDEWRTYWPNATSDEDFAKFINTVPKYIVSNTLDDVSWGDYKTVNLIKGDPTAEVTRLKQQPGKTIAVLGSPTLVNSLLYKGLLDELLLMIHPVVVGKGKRLFNDGDALKRLKLVESKISSTGVPILRYVPRE